VRFIFTRASTSLRADGISNNIDIFRTSCTTYFLDIDTLSVHLLANDISENIDIFKASCTIYFFDGGTFSVHLFNNIICENLINLQCQADIQDRQALEE